MIDLKELLSKAVYSSLAGLPISFILNERLFDWLQWVLNNHSRFESALIIAIPFTVASIIRIFVIDWAYHRFNVNISPDYLLGKLIKEMRCKLKYG